MTDPKEIGKLFRQAREDRGLSVEEVNFNSRIHPDVIKDIENGTYERLGKIYIKSFSVTYTKHMQ